MTGKQIKKLAADRGYRGVKQVGYTQILIPDVPKVKDTYYQKRKKHKLFCKRAGIEPTIGHLKEDYRLSRNFYKGVEGDAINVILAAVAYNFKRAMRVLLWLIENISVKFDCSNCTLMIYIFKGRLMSKIVEEKNGCHDLLEMVFNAFMQSERKLFLEESNDGNKGNGYRPFRTIQDGKSFI